MGPTFSIQELVNLESPGDQRVYLRAHAGALTDDVAESLKLKADELVRSDLQRCLELCDLLGFLAKLTEEPHHLAQNYMARANAYLIGRADFDEAIRLYDQAAEVYRGAGREADEAHAQIGKVWALASLGRYEEAFETGDWVAEQLAQAERWTPLAKLYNNLGGIRGRLGADKEALAYFDRGVALYEAHGAEAGALPGIQFNRAIVLRNLGRYQQSIEASENAIRGLSQTDQQIRQAQAMQSLAVTQFVRGHYNEALRLLEEAKSIFQSDQRTRESLLADLFKSECLLELRQFQQVIDHCRGIRKAFSGRGMNFEVGQALLAEAAALSRLGRAKPAGAALEEARRLFEAEGNAVWTAYVDLERATLAYAQGAFQTSFDLAAAGSRVFESLDLAQSEAIAKLLAARAVQNLGDFEAGDQLVGEARAIGSRLNDLNIRFQAHLIRANRFELTGDIPSALDAYERAIESLERVRGRIMVEYRAGFVEDKTAAYQGAVRACLNLDDHARAFSYAERAKSRTLLDLLAQRISLRIDPRNTGDALISTELMALRDEYDRRIRHWRSEEDIGKGVWLGSGTEHESGWQDILELEKQMTENWHQLLIRNAEYAGVASLWQVRTEPVQQYLDDQVVMIEYFPTGRGLVAFLVNAQEVTAWDIPVAWAEIERLTRWLKLNLNQVPVAPAGHLPDLEHNARLLLQQLYHALLGPIRAKLQEYPRLIVVPHGLLHYLPFHAFYDGERYLAERFQISYLPTSSILRYCHDVHPVAGGLLAVGHSAGDRLPHAVQEARQLADLMDGTLLAEGDATGSNLRENIDQFRILHLAAHGDFRADNPLFSGLTLEDGLLTTLDVFDLELRASLVTLSGCDTGRHVLGGGDELLGLMRAFLYAGAASVMMSMWAVEDRSTAEFMTRFYRAVTRGGRKDEALQATQVSMLRGEGSLEADLQERYRHPYYWAPFLLAGAAGQL